MSQYASTLNPYIHPYRWQKSSTKQRRNVSFFSRRFLVRRHGYKRSRILSRCEQLTTTSKTMNTDKEKEIKRRECAFFFVVLFVSVWYFYSKVHQTGEMNKRWTNKKHQFDDNCCVIYRVNGLFYICFPLWWCDHFHFTVKKKRKRRTKEF